MAQTWRVRRYKSSTAPRPPLDTARLEALALHYVGRYATTQAKLAAYLARRLARQGWEGEDPPPVDAIVARLAGLGYVDDRAFATARAGSLSRRGLGPRRLDEALRAAGVSEQDGADARDKARENALASALALARRRRLGPFAGTPADPDARRRAIAVLMRAGHEFALARQIAFATCESDLDPERF